MCWCMLWCIGVKAEQNLSVGVVRTGHMMLYDRCILLVRFCWAFRAASWFCLVVFNYAAENIVFLAKCRKKGQS